MYLISENSFSLSLLSSSQSTEVCPVLRAHAGAFDRGHLSEAGAPCPSFPSLLFPLLRLLQSARGPHLLRLQGSRLLRTPLCRMPIQTMQGLR